MEKGKKKPSVSVKSTPPNSREISPESLLKGARHLLEHPLPWPPELESGVSYGRLHDDHDGKFTGEIVVVFGPDGDAHMRTETPCPGEVLRFRNGFGGSRSPRTYNALVLLALAMKLDAEEKPDVPPGQAQ